MWRRVGLLAMLGAVALMTVQASVAQSAPRRANRSETVVNDWTGFSWGADGWSEVITLSYSGAGTLWVTDAYCRGDVFEVYDRGVLLGTTEDVAVDPECDDDPFLDNPFRAYISTTYSSGQFALVEGAGDHEIQMRAIQNPFEVGGGFIHEEAAKK
jgi:hypothetical protein